MYKVNSTVVVTSYSFAILVIVLVNYGQLRTVLVLKFASAVVFFFLGWTRIAATEWSLWRFAVIRLWSTLSFGEQLQGTSCPRSNLNRQQIEACTLKHLKARYGPPEISNLHHIIVPYDTLKALIL